MRTALTRPHRVHETGLSYTDQSDRCVCATCEPFDDGLSSVSGILANKNAAVRIPEFRGDTLFRVEFVRGPLWTTPWITFGPTRPGAPPIDNNGIEDAVVRLSSAVHRRTLDFRYVFLCRASAMSIVENAARKIRSRSQEVCRVPRLRPTAPGRFVHEERRTSRSEQRLRPVLIQTGRGPAVLAATRPRRRGE